LPTKPSPTTIEEFTAIVARTGLQIAPEKMKEFHFAHDRLMVLLARLRRIDRPREAEPMATFKPDIPASS
jgi:hypothetical protein